MNIWEKVIVILVYLFFGFLFHVMYYLQIIFLACYFHVMYYCKAVAKFASATIPVEKIVCYHGFSDR